MTDARPSRTRVGALYGSGHTATLQHTPIPATVWECIIYSWISGKNIVLHEALTCWSQVNAKHVNALLQLTT